MAWIQNVAYGMTEHAAAIAALGGSPIAVPSGEASDVPPGAPVAVLSGMGRLATAASLALARPIGLALVAATPTNPITIVPDGQVLALTTAQWDAVTGGSGGLIAGLNYYVSAVAGQLTNVPTTTPGQVVCVVGRALSPTILLVDVGEPVLL